MKKIYLFLVLVSFSLLSCKSKSDEENQEKSTKNEQTASFRIALGSCNRQDMSQEFWSTIEKDSADIFIWGGDNIYADTPDMKLMEAKYDTLKNNNYYQSFVNQLPYGTIGVWDDHDYGPNNSDRSYRMREEALEIFRRYWANPGYGTSETDGIFTKYKYSDVEFFLMDDRYHRAPNQLKKEDKDFFGEAQLQWLMDSLVSSNATFKIVVVGNQVTNKMKDSESLIAYGEEYEQLMDFLDKHDIPGVLFLSGDRHFTELLKTDREDSYPIYEFTSSPLSSGTYGDLNESEEYDNPQRVDGTLVYDDQNFGMMHVRGEEDNRRLVLETYGSDGEMLWDYTIHENDLTNK